MYCQITDPINKISSKNSAHIKNNPRSSQLILDDGHRVNANYYTQNQLHDEIKYNSINLSTSYWNIVFESIKSVNRYWAKILNIGINNST